MLAERLQLRVVAIDGPGHAQSPVPAAEAFRPTALARLATEILDELEVERAVRRLLVGSDGRLLARCPRQDGPFPPLERLARLVPQVEIVQLASSSHDLLLDAPADVARAVGDWLAGLEA